MNENHIAARLPDTESAEQTRALDRNHEGKTQGARRPHVCFTLCRTKLLDVDAKYDSIKDLLDGLQIAGLIPGDREDQITLAVEQVKVHRRKDEKTLITLDL